MNHHVLFSNAFISVEYLPEKQMIYHTVHKPLGNEIDMLKNALNAGTDALIENGLCKWLSDDRLTGFPPEGFLEWGITEWQPRTIEGGWKYWANVVPTEVKVAGALVPVIENLHKVGLRMRVFTNVEEALAWLDEME